MLSKDEQSVMFVGRFTSHKVPAVKPRGGGGPVLSPGPGCAPQPGTWPSAQRLGRRGLPRQAELLPQRDQALPHPCVHVALGRLDVELQSWGAGAAARGGL